MSGGGGTSTTTIGGPPSDVRPYLTNALNEGENLYDNSPLYRPGMNNWMQTGLSRMADIGNQGLQKNFGAEVLDRGQMFAGNVLSGHGVSSPTAEWFGGIAANPTQSAFGGQLGRSAGGEYLGSNPMFDYLESTAQGDYLEGGSAWDVAEENIRQRMPGLMNQYALAGRSGSAAANAAANREIAGQLTLAQDRERQRQMQAASMLGGAYGQERGLQDAAAMSGLGTQMNAANLAQQGHFQGLGFQGQMANLANALAAGDYTAAQNLYNAGQTAETHERNRVEEPWQRWERYMSTMLPAMGAAGTEQIQNQGTNWGQTLMGGAMMGLNFLPGGQFNHVFNAPAAAVAPTGAAPFL